MEEDLPLSPQEGLTDVPPTACRHSPWEGVPATRPTTVSVLHMCAGSGVPLPCTVETSLVVGTTPNAQKPRFLEFSSGCFRGCRKDSHLPPSWRLMARQSAPWQAAVASVRPPRDCLPGRGARTQAQGSLPPPSALQSHHRGSGCSAHVCVSTHERALVPRHARGTRIGHRPGLSLSRSPTRPQRRCFSLSSPEIWEIA